MTVVILDTPYQASVAEQLPLSEDVRQITAPEGTIGPAERVIYLANLDSGGKRAQMEILRSNPQVEEWLVLSVGTEEDSWKAFRDKLSGVSGQVHTFSTVEDLIRALDRPLIRKNTCLVLSRQETSDADSLIALLSVWLPDWQFEKAAFESDPEIVFHTTCSRILLLGRTTRDFYGARFSENSTPLIVIPRLEENVLRNMRSASLMRNVFKNIRGLKWGTDTQRQNFYIISTAYENFRLETQKDPNLFNSLAMDRRFDMWDCYGLPELRSAYTKERMSEFLSQFDGCERIAARLRNNNL